MIEITKVNLDGLRVSESKLIEVIKTRYLDDKTIELLDMFFQGKNIKIAVEYPYYDNDYLSTYYLFYCKKQGYYPKKCYRLHIYDSEKYRGSIVLRPTKGGTNIGKTYINPCLFLDEGYLILNKFTNNILGKEIKIEAFPWMKQETDVTVCAHVALWSLIRYYGSKYSNYQDIPMGEIVIKTPESSQRKIPMTDLNMAQIPETLKRQGFAPIVVRRGIENQEFENELLTYIESGIPLIGCLTNKKHSVAIMGHGEIDVFKLKEYETLNQGFGKNNVILSCELINNIIVNDDAIGPYLSIDRKFNVFDTENYNNWTHTRPYSMADFDFFIVPLYDRMQFSYASVVQAVKIFLQQNRMKFEDNFDEQMQFLNPDEKYVSRIYISSAKTLKCQMSKSLENNNDLKYFIKHMELPKFVWNIDFSTISEYHDGKISAKIIIDTTCCNIETQPWLLLHNSECIWIKEENDFKDIWKVSKSKIVPYDMYKSNLKSVKDIR